MAETTTFSLRLPPREYRSLRTVAFLNQRSIAEQARIYVLDGLLAALDPVAIERHFEDEKQRLLADAAYFAEEPTDG